jgi:hypothetical protein
VAKAKTHKKQHYVPRTYLAAWVDPEKPEKMDDYVWRFTPNGDPAGRKAPENLFTETDFYTIPMPDGSRNLDFEHGLSGLETAFATIRSKLDRLHIFDDPVEISQLLAFIVAMSGRTRSHRDFQRSQWKPLLEMIESNERQFGGGRPAPPIHFNTDARSVSVSSGEVRDFVERPIQTLMPIYMETMLPILFSMDLAIVVTNTKPGFVTSDDPVVVYDPTVYRRPPFYRDAALVGKDTEVTLPVSPRQLILLNWKGVSGYCEAPSRVIDDLNHRTVAHADQYVIVNANAKRDEWFNERELPDDAWEKMHAAKTHD